MPERALRTEDKGALRNSRRDDAGAVLILALVFLIVVGGIVGSLADWATNDLNNTAHFTSARSLQYAASSATETAIQDIRYSSISSTSAMLNASPPTPCWGSGSNSELATTEAGSSVNVAVWCSLAWNPSSADTRVLTISACPVIATPNAALCASTPYLQAVVTFDDYPSGVSAPNPVQASCQAGICGTGMTVDSWQWSPVVPAVSGLTTTKGPITGLTQTTITGSGFVSGATTVDFVEESAGSPAGANVILPATGVIVLPGSTTTLSAVSPSVTSGTTYYVTVTTPAGTSAYAGLGDVFTFTPVVPTVSGISPNAGSTGGGTAVTIKGNGFFSGATVSFGSIPSKSVTVVSSTLITAYAPAVSTAGGYNVSVVTSPGGTSPTNPNDVFTYSVLQPNGG